MKRNQIMITALAIMIATAGYLNFAGNQISEETLVVSDEVLTEDEMTAMLDLSEEDIATDIVSMDEEGVLTENYLEEGMEVAEVTSDIVVDMSGSDETASANAQAADSGMEVADAGELTADAEAAEVTSDIVADISEESGEFEADKIEGTPGEAVFTSTRAVSTLSAAKLLKEQTRAKNKEALEEIINNSVLDSPQKEEAVGNMVAMTERSEREMEAEILLSTKGFTEAVVSMGENSVDVVVCKETLSDAELAQIMDIVMRKTKIAAENIIISQVTQQ